jgi:hypothetical protein
MSPEEYEDFFSVIGELMSRPSSWRMRTALSRKLLERGALPGNEIDAILDEAEDPSWGKASVA